MKYTLGIDIGSTASKCIILDEQKNIVGKSLVDVGAGTSGPARALEAVFKDAHLTKEDIAFTVATGYGRNSSKDFNADAQMSELSCHAKGAAFLFPDVKTVIDIGGQDAKVLRIENAMLSNFQMNDKCAAGTGRFLDVMARVLELDVAELGDYDAKSTETISISSTCTVFAESEVISQLALGKSKADIIKGVHESIANRIFGLVNRIGAIPEIVMTGGVAQNKGVVRAISQLLGYELKVDPLTQYVGALGAALFAKEKSEK